MMCLFANLSLRFDAAFPADGHLKSASPYEFHCAAGLGRHWDVSCPREWPNACDRLSRLIQQPQSRQFGRGLSPRRCQPLVTRIVQSLKLRCAQPVKHPNPHLSISIAVFSARRYRLLRRRLTERLSSGVPWRCNLTGRLREGKLVVSGSHSKRFFRPKTSPAVFAGSKCGVLMALFSP